MEYYSHTCLCNCGGKIEVKRYHKYYGTPKYISGHNKSMLGKFQTEEARIKMSFIHKGQKPWNKGKKDVYSEDTIQKMSNSHKGKKQSEDHIQNRAQRQKGKKQSKETIEKRVQKNKGKKRSEETRQKISKLAKERYKNPENNPNWQNGKSFEEYGIEFNKELKQDIKNRDFNICQTPGCMNTENLHVHHIDYNKKNNDKENLTTLCRSCHGKTNGKNKRDYWTEFYTNIITLYL